MVKWIFAKQHFLLIFKSHESQNVPWKFYTYMLCSRQIVDKIHFKSNKYFNKKATGLYKSDSLAKIKARP